MWIFIGIGALLLLSGKRGAQVARTVGGKIVSFTADTLLSAVQAASANMPLPPYSSLPQGPAETGALAADRSVDSLDASFKPRAVKLVTELNAELAKHGYVAKIVETYRSPTRQAYLWGIGRLYQAPGRTGIVTKIKDVTGKHPQRKAIDVGFFRVDGSYVGGKEVEDKIVPVIKGIASRLESAHGVLWGGNFKGSFRDYPHWEDRT